MGKHNESCVRLRSVAPISVLSPSGLVLFDLWLGFTRDWRRSDQSLDLCLSVVSGIYQDL